MTEEELDALEFWDAIKSACRRLELSEGTTIIYCLDPTGSRPGYGFRKVLWNG
jgi:triphosphoribosyl-dephospho-CoA synthetase